MARGIEKKTFTSGITSKIQPANTGEWATVPVGLIAQGINDGQRIGNKISIQSIQVLGLLSVDKVDSVYEHAVRILVVRDKAYQGGTPPIWADIFDSDGKFWRASMRLPEEFSRYQILARKTVNFRQFQSVTTNFDNNTHFHEAATQMTKQFKLFVPLFGKGTAYNYTGATATAADLDHGAIFIMIAESFFDAKSEAEACSMQVKHRVRYTDL